MGEVPSAWESKKEEDPPYNKERKRGRLSICPGFAFVQGILTINDCRFGRAVPKSKGRTIPRKEKFLVKQKKIEPS